MYQSLLHAHSGVRYLVITLLALAALKHLIGLLGGGKWKIWDQRLLLWSLIVVDLQVVLGLVMLIQGQRWRIPLYMEHATTMILVAVLIHVARKLTKKRLEDGARFRRAVACLLPAILLLALGIYRVTMP